MPYFPPSLFASLAAHIKSMKSIKVVVTPEGEIIIEAIGFKGRGCENATAALEKALGVKTGGKKIMPDYYQEEIPAKVKVGRWL